MIGRNRTAMMAGGGSSGTGAPGRCVGRGFLAAVAGLILACLAGAQAQPTKRDSGWVPLFNGKDFSNGFYVYSNGYVEIGAQTKFQVQDSMIHAGGSYAILTTVKEYAYYKVRVDYRFGASVGASANAGLMILMDNAQAKVVKSSTRPRSIEVNCRRDNDYPWSLWAGSGYGPYMATTVKAGTDRYLAKAEGGVAHVVDPMGDPQRTLRSSYPNTELPPGQWNHGEAWVYGDSGVFLLNGTLRTAGWNWTVKVGSQMVKVASGGVGVQTEGSDIWYRNWEIQELDPVTRQPLHATRGCTDSKSTRFNPRAVVEDGSCNGTAVLEPRRVRGEALKPRLILEGSLGAGTGLPLPRLRALDGRLVPGNASGFYIPEEIR